MLTYLNVQVWLTQSSKSVVDGFQTPHHGLSAVGFLNNFQAGFPQNYPKRKGFRLQPE
jgi:hypothetical protein